MVDGTVSELWRYPVKSMAGERATASEVGAAGLVGDRAFAVVDAASAKVGSAKHPRLWGQLLECRARYLPDTGGVAIELPDGTSTGSDDPAVDERLSALLGRPVRLTAVAPPGNSYLAVWPEGLMPAEFLAQVAVDGPHEPGEALTSLTNASAAPPGTFFDVAALHVVTRATLDHLGAVAPASRFAVERYRPNVVLDGDLPPFAENGWPGATLELGPQLQAPVLIPTMRCIMTTLAQGDLPRDNGTLKAVAEHNRIEIPGLGTWSCVGAYATVGAPGAVAVGERWGITPA